MVASSLTVQLALQRGQAAGLDRLETQLLLSELLQCDRSWLISHDDACLSDTDAARFEDWLAQRLDQVPLAYLCGHKEFHGLRLRVTRDTLIPRPDTEVLVDWALEVLAGQIQQGLASPRVIDMGTGSGAIALAIKHRCPAAQVAALDFSRGALAVAQANAQDLRLAVEFIQGSWWQALQGREFDLIVSNPPYIAGQDPHLPALRHEPISALTPGGDGLADLRTLIEGAPAHLAPGGALLLEHGWDQARAAAQMLAKTGFVKLACRQDLAGMQRASGGIWPKL